MSAALRDRAKSECIEALKRYDFVEFRKGYLNKKINDEFGCWIGLNFGVYSGHVSLSPFVGVHVEKLDRQFSLLSGFKYDNRTASYAAHLGELAPSEPAFDFFDADDVSRTAYRLAALYADVGFTFSRSIASYSALLPLLHERVSMLGGFPERYALCLYELGRRDEAVAYVIELGEDWEHIRPFTENFLKFCGSTVS